MPDITIIVILVSIVLFFCGFILVIIAIFESRSEAENRLLTVKKELDEVNAGSEALKLELNNKVENIKTTYIQMERLKDELKDKDRFREETIKEKEALLSDIRNELQETKFAFEKLKGELGNSVRQINGLKDELKHKEEASEKVTKEKRPDLWNTWSKSQKVKRSKGL